MVALFSRSGSVLAAVLNQLAGDKELIILTNNFDEDSLDPEFVQKYGMFTTTEKHDDIEEILMKLNPQPVFLFGYMRILSKEVCERHQIYNLHPGDIVLNPELKGKDPIEKFFELYWKEHIVNYGLGCVIHKVTEEVDSGEVLRVRHYEAESVQEANAISRMIAIEMWVDFINSLN